jgi:hypothetical protein
MGSSRSRRLFLGISTLILGAVFTTPLALAQDYLARTNEPFKSVPQDKRSELLILPALAKMEAPPAEVDSIDKAVLILPTSAGWETALKWVQAQPQKDVLKALSDVTKEEDYHTAMVFAQGYGVDEVADYPALISAGMYTELGDPPTLATAKFGYLDKMEQMQWLSNVEATRRVGEKDFIGAIDTMFDYLYFSRQMAERPMLKEKMLGMRGIRQALER